MQFPNMDEIRGAVSLGHQKADRLLQWQELIHKATTDLLEATRQANERQYSHHRANAAIADANGLVELRYRVRSGGWHLIGVAISGSTASATTGCAIYRNDTGDNINLIDVVTYGTLASLDFSDGEYVNEGEVVIIRFFGMTPGDRCTAVLKYKELRQIPQRASGGE